MPAQANSVGRATTAGTGQFRDNLWWFDMTGYVDATARGVAGQNFSFTLPDGSTLTFNLRRTGSANAFDDVASPTWNGAAIGNTGGAYIGIPGRPFIYGLGNFVLQITNIQLRDSANNARSFTLFATDSESTGLNGITPEALRFVTNGGAWQQFELINATNGGTPTETLSGVGSQTVDWNGTGNTNNGSIVLSTANPTSLTLTTTNAAQQSFGLGIAMPSVTVTKTLGATGRIAAADQFTMNMRYTTPSVALGTATTGGTGTTVSTGTVATNPLPGSGLTLSEAMAAGSASPLTYYRNAIACTNTRAGSTTVLPSGAGTSFTLTPAAGDVISCALTNTPTARVMIQKISNGGVGTFAFSGTNGIANQNIITITAGTGVNGATQILTTSGGATSVTEAAPPTNFTLTGIACSGLGAGGAATVDLANRTVALNAAATAAGATILCTFTNDSFFPLSVTKTSVAFSDPVNGTTNPKTIPGSFADYTITVNNPTSSISAGNIVIVDALPSQTRLFVNTVSPGVGPVVMTPGTSGLTYTFTSLSSTTDDVDFSCDGGTTWTCVPVPNGSGVSTSVTNIRINPKGNMAPGSSSTLRFRVQVQ